MCVTISYLCPVCECPSGHVDRDGCPPEEKCPYKLSLTCLMKSHHFPGWHCANADCKYSREGQRVEHVGIMEAIRAAGKAAGRLDDEDSGEDGQYKPTFGPLAHQTPRLQ
jgi:hypothetical protein